MGCNTSQESLQQKDNNENSAAEGDHLKQDIQDINNKEETGLVSIDLNRTEPPPAKEEEEAAVKIQAAFRGHKTRKNINMKQPAGVQNEPEPTQQELEAEFRADDVELCHAATRIQASFRGHMARKQVDKKDETQPGQDKPGEEELDIDLSDPELNKAAVKIQASFRGHMVRKENEDTQ